MRTWARQVVGATAERAPSLFPEGTGWLVDDARKGCEPLNNACMTSERKIGEGKTIANTCLGFEGCKAPVCPMDDSFREAVWFAGEDYCQAYKYRRENWRKIQKKIAKVNSLVPVGGYFDLAMLEGILRVRRGIGGASPDKMVGEVRRAVLSLD